MHLCGEGWLTSSKFSSLIEDDEEAFIIPAIDTRSLVLSIKNSNLLLLEAGKLLPLLHLSCLSLVFLLMCCFVFSLKPTRSMSDGRPIASPLFRRLAGRGVFFVVSCFDGFYTLFYL